MFLRMASLKFEFSRPHVICSLRAWLKNLMNDADRGVARLLVILGPSCKLKTKPTDNIVARIFLKGVGISSGMFLGEGLGASPRPRLNKNAAYTKCALRQ